MMMMKDKMDQKSDKDEVDGMKQEADTRDRVIDV